MFVRTKQKILLVTENVFPEFSGRAAIIALPKSWPIIAPNTDFDPFENNGQ